MRLKSGIVRLVDPDLREVPTAVRHVLLGEFFGEEALLGEGASYLYTAEALSECAVEFISPEEVSGEVWREVALSLATQINRQAQEAAKRKFTELKARLASYLLFLARTPLLREDEKGAYVSISQESLAVGVGSIRESVAKTLKEMGEEGLVLRGRKRIYLVDEKGLEKIGQPPFGG